MSDLEAHLTELAKLLENDFPGVAEEINLAMLRLRRLEKIEEIARRIVQHRHRFEEFDLDGAKKVILDKLQKEVEAR